MFNIRIIQANYGDCIILEYGTQDDKKFALIDGGPKGVWRDHLKGEIDRLKDENGELEFVAISHADSDHITGVLDFFAILESLHSSGETDYLNVKTLWYNSFANTIDTNGANIRARLSNLMSAASAQNIMTNTNAALQGFYKGNQLRIKALQLGLEINKGFPDNIVVTDTAPVLNFENMQVTIVGPTQENLNNLRTEWLEWLDDNEANLALSDPQALANADSSVKNLSSIMFLVEADGKRSLFTGDGRSDHLLEGLEQAGLLDQSGSMHIDVLKVMHHGSDRNVTRSFFKKVTADTYIISANGHPDNPDLSTLIWMVEAAKDAGREIHIIATNETRSTRKLIREYDPSTYGYKLEIMPEHWNYRLIELSN